MDLTCEHDTPDVPGRRGILFGLWLLAGLLLLSSLDALPLTRTQEARVLVTGREMVGAPLADWLVPHTNGEVRLRKPPLAYWLAGCAMAALGAHAWAGRIPFALAAWLTLALTFAIGRRMFTPRVGVLAATTLLGTFLLFRHGRFAETDVLALLFVTAGVYAVVRGWEADGLWAATGWFHASAAAMALAVLSKGPPGAYPLIFLLALGVVERRGRPILRWFVSGAWATAAIIAVPWFIYVSTQQQAHHLKDDLTNSAYGGRGHSGWFYEYVPDLLVAALPWTPLVVIGLVVGVRRWRAEPSLRIILIWVGVILLPLLVWGNKQPHYLLPLMPPLMVLAGYVLDEAVRVGGRVGLGRAVSHILLGTLLVGGISAVALPAFGWFWRGRLAPADALVALSALFVTTFVAALWHRRGFASSVWSCCAGGAIFVGITMGRWWPSLHAATTEQVASQLLARFGDGPYVFRRSPSLPLLFTMRRVIPAVADEELSPGSPGASRTVFVIEEIEGAQPRPVADQRWHEVFRTEAGERRYVVYAVDR